jgi:PP-loop superfamily ATP-utilizing enzyme
MIFDVICKLSVIGFMSSDMLQKSFEYIIRNISTFWLTVNVLKKETSTRDTKEEYKESCYVCLNTCYTAVTW